MTSPGQLVEHFFRHEFAHVVAVLTRAFGVRRLPMIEDMVQVALLEAMETWQRQGVPTRPAAWIHRVATQRMIDELRREAAFHRAVERSGRSIRQQEETITQWFADDDLGDSVLRMMFVCCHPALDHASQLALALKTLCGFGVSEVAQALLLPEETVRKRLQRARSRLADINVSMELPPPEERAARRRQVHDVLYLMFNEGYSPARGAAVIRDDVCEEAVRLTHLLAHSEVGSAETRALLALLLFQSARLKTRTDVEGITLLLEDQDRRQWDRRLIDQAILTLMHSECDQPSVFHLEAAIAWQHCRAAATADTDWPAIVDLYERLCRLRPSPVSQLNLAIALGECDRFTEALPQLKTLQQHRQLTDYPYLGCAMARWHERQGQWAEARRCYERLLQGDLAEHQRRLIERRQQAVASHERD